jgi:glycosyl transferase family 25
VNIKEIPIFVVNLKQDIEKKRYMQKLSHDKSLDFRYIKAVYGKDLSDSEIEKVYNKKVSIKNNGRELTKGEIGCALSHISIYKKIIEDNIKNAIIFEDDITITDNFISVINSIKNLPQDWELILLGYYSQVSNELESKSSLRKRKKIFKNIKAVRLVQIAYGTHGYMINQKGAKKLLKELSLIKKPIDHYTGVEKYVNMYAIQPRVVRLSELFKEQSSISIERSKQQNSKKNINKKREELSFLQKILQNIGVLNTIRNRKLYINQVKKLKEYS